MSMNDFHNVLSSWQQTAVHYGVQQSSIKNIKCWPYILGGLVSLNVYSGYGPDYIILIGYTLFR